MTWSVSTIVAEVVTSDGTAAWTDARSGPGFRSFQATPPRAFDDDQPGTIPISIRHDGPIIGHVDYLEESLGYGNGGMFGVGVVEGVRSDLIDGLVFCSPEIRANAMATMVGRGRDTRVSGTMHATEATLDALALVDATASIGATRVRALPGDYRDANDRSRWGHRGVPEILKRAAEAATHELRWSRPRNTPIHRPVREIVGRSSGRMTTLPDGSRAEIEYREARITSVGGRPIGAH